MAVDREHKRQSRDAIKREADRLYPGSNGFKIILNKAFMQGARFATKMQQQKYLDEVKAHKKTKQTLNRATNRLVVGSLMK